MLSQFALPPSPSPRSPRLPTPVVTIAAAFGGLWTLLALALVVVGNGTSGFLHAATLITNVTGGLLLCGIAWLGTRPRPETPLGGARLAVTCAVCAVPAAAAIVEGVAARHTASADSAAFDLILAMTVAIAAFSVARSRPTER